MKERNKKKTNEQKEIGLKRQKQNKILRSYRQERKTMEWNEVQTKKESSRFFFFFVLVYNDSAHVCTLPRRSLFLFFMIFRPDINSLVLIVMT